MKYKNLKEKFFFHHTEEGSDIYFCNCGKKITKENNKANPEEVTMSVKKGEYDIDIMSRFDDVVNVVCPKCKKDFSKQKNLQFIIESNKYFYSYFSFEKNEHLVTLRKIKVKSSCTNKSRYVRFKDVDSYISVNKKTKQIFFKSYGKTKEREFSLDSIVYVLKEFYLEKDKLNMVDNLIDIHKFLSEVASVVVDSKNMDIVEGLMNQMIGKPGVDVLFRINSIFFGIICYSNLSTIALTKGTVFLFDMMNNCSMPNVSTLEDEGVTSPLKIFNFLVSLENEKAQEEIELEKNEESEFVYKTKDNKLHSLKFDLERWGFKDDNKSKSAIVKSGGRLNVREDLKVKSVSKFIFNKIDKFNDYKRLIRFTKFLSYEELVVLVMNHDIQFIVNLFDLIEFRDDITKDSLKQIIPLVLDWLENGRTSYNFDSSFKNLGDSNGGLVHENGDVKLKEDVKVNYSAVPSFSFYEYDDCVRMINALDWDRNKEFNKIKKVSELKTYHDKLVEHFNLLSDKAKNKRFVEFAKKFKYLEEYDGDYSLTLLSQPKLVLDAAVDMKNCAGSYVTRISKGQYLLLIAHDKSKEKTSEEKTRFMLGLNVLTTGLMFEQFKADCNFPASNRQKEMIKLYLEDKDISYKDVGDLRLSRATENKNLNLYL
tara:strand:- start:1461 stop:3416 length:1956 start_codon:yes stop_codon:yes gene_type:complete